MEYKKLTCVLFTLVWCSLTLTIRAASPICNTVPSGVFDYGQTCSSSSQCVTGLCFGSRCACDSGTTYSTCAAACVADCNTTIMATTGTITSPGYPSSNSISQCFWTIQGTTGNIIEFNITYMDMGTVYDCSINYLELFEGPSSSYRTFGKMCTSWNALTVSTTNSMYVVFRTSASGRFHAKFKIQGSVDMLYESGKIASPRYPLKYLNNQDFTWTLATKTGIYLILNISFVETEGCSTDYITVYDGSNTAARTFDRICGRNISTVIASSTNYLVVNFRTDSTVTFKGFYAEFYSQGTSNILSGTKGFIISPGFPIAYPNNLNITWRIEGDLGAFIVLNITSFDLGPVTSNCSNDYLQVFDGSSSSSRQLATLCGNVVPGLIASTSNYMYIVFRTDSSYTQRGFRASYSTQISDDPNIGMIAGATVGSLVLVILLVLVVIVIYSRKVKSNKEPKPKTSKFTDNVSAFTISSLQDNNYSRPYSANPDHVYDDLQRLSVDGPQSQDTEHENLQSATIKRPATYTDMTAAKVQQSSTNTEENEHVYANVALPL